VKRSSKKNIDLILREFIEKEGQDPSILKVNIRMQRTILY